MPLGTWELLWIAVWIRNVWSSSFTGTQKGNSWKNVTRQQVTKSSCALIAALRCSFIHCHSVNFHIRNSHFSRNPCLCNICIVCNTQWGSVLYSDTVQQRVRPLHPEFAHLCPPSAGLHMSRVWTVERGGPCDKPRLCACTAHSLITAGAPFPPSFGKGTVVMAVAHGSLLQEREETSPCWRPKRFTLYKGHLYSQENISGIVNIHFQR